MTDFNTRNGVETITDLPLVLFTPEENRSPQDFSHYKVTTSSPFISSAPYPSHRLYKAHVFKGTLPNSHAIAKGSSSLFCVFKAGE